MANIEALKSPDNNNEKSRKDLEHAGAERREQLRQKLERAGETSKENLETATARALEYAKSKEVSKADKKEESRDALPEHHRQKHGPLSKKERDASYRKTMKQVQAELPAGSRVFSKFIHAKGIEKTSEVVGGTIARPNAMLAGSLCAFAFTLALYLIARYEGYPLTGTETIATFAVGWATGLLIDYLHLEITGKKF